MIFDTPSLSFVYYFMTSLLSVQIPFLNDLLIIIGLSVLVILAFHRLKIPPIVGYLITGVVAGPSVLGFVKGGHEIDMLAEVGVVLLMFTIGLEFSLRSLLRIWRYVFIGGGLQVALSVGLAALLARQGGLPWSQAVFIGFLVSLSSTAIVLKVLQQKGELDALHGRMVLAILIFQDLIVVPMMLLVPIMAGQAGDLTSTLLWLSLKVLGVLAFVAVATRYLMPWLLYQVARTRSRELFILSMVVVCFAVAWGTGELGLSLALGAFLAGLIISESEYSYQATSDILPFRELFASIFFVSVGMLVDVQFFVAHPGAILLGTLGIMVLKLLVVVLAILWFGFPVRTVLLVGFALCQVGEFAFVLAKMGQGYGLLTNNLYQYFLSISTLTMVLTPFVLLGAERLSSLMMRAPLPARLRQRLAQRSYGTQLPQSDHAPLEDHLVIIGFGLNGQNLARVARSSGIPYVIIETNPDTVRKFQYKGEPIIFGDATKDHILEHVAIVRARVAVVAVSDPVATRQVVVLLRQHNPALHILARTRYQGQVEELLQRGANEVVPEELESSIEIFSRVLGHYLVPQEQIVAFGRKVRQAGYQALRDESATAIAEVPRQQSKARIDVTAFTVPRASWLAHRRLADLALRKQYGLNIVAIRRDEELITHVYGETQIQPQDELFVYGEPDSIQAFCQSLR